MEVARQKKLRPEDRDPIPVDPKKPEGEKIKTVFEGTVQGIDEQEWKEEISDLAEEFKQEKKKNKKKPKRQDDDDFEVTEGRHGPRPRPAQVRLLQYGSPRGSQAPARRAARPERRQ